MSKKRQQVFFDPRRRAGAPITTLSWEYASGQIVALHFHEEDQLVYAVRGVMNVKTSRGMWVVPPGRAVWVPARMPHAIEMTGRVFMRTLYLRPGLARALPRRCAILNVSPLVHELIVHTCTLGTLYLKTPSERRLLGVLLDQLDVAPFVPLELPVPKDPRALRVAEVLMADPADARPVSELCAAAGASKRTLERLFVEETKMTLGRWRQQLGLLHAVRLLAKGEKVTSVALDVGYASPSAFIAMFRRALGKTPTEYVAGAAK